MIFLAAKKGTSKKQTKKATKKDAEQAPDPEQAPDSKISGKLKFAAEMAKHYATLNRYMADRHDFLLSIAKASDMNPYVPQSQRVHEKKALDMIQAERGLFKEIVKVAVKYEILPEKVLKED